MFTCLSIDFSHLLWDHFWYILNYVLFWLRVFFYIRFLLQCCWDEDHARVATSQDIASLPISPLSSGAVLALTAMRRHGCRRGHDRGLELLLFLFSWERSSAIIQWMKRCRMVYWWRRLLLRLLFLLWWRCRRWRNPAYLLTILDAHQDWLNCLGVICHFGLLRIVRQDSRIVHGLCI